MAAMTLGAYVHVPFCRHRCDYCAFATWTDRGQLVDRYLAACRRHIDLEVAAGLEPLDTVFVGGGTPSLVPASGLASVLSALPLGDGAEITVECNPDDVTTDLLSTYVDAGVNRISLGVQSLVPHVLTALGRIHDPENVQRAAAAARQLGLALNVDLIYGAAGESRDDWAETVRRAIDLGPAHVSAYALTVEAGTALWRDVARHPDDDDQADKYEIATDLLGAAGFEWYEISNWAQPGHRCRHNLRYWTMGDYVAIGCAAHGHRDGVRYWNRHTPERYVEAIESHTSPVAGWERLDADGRRVEAAQLAIRTERGVVASAFDPDDLAGPLAGLLAIDQDRATLTPAGRLLANEVAVRIQ